MINPLKEFHSEPYLKHTEACFDHIERIIKDINLSVEGISVLDLVAGIGDQAVFWKKKGAQVTAIEGRKENIDVMISIIEGINIVHADLEFCSDISGNKFDVVFCFGLLYHLKNPKNIIKYASEMCKEYFLLETCVSFGDEVALNNVPEPIDCPSQAYSGVGCRPTRKWVYQELKHNFKYVYQPRYQPNHPNFPKNWLFPLEHKGNLARTSFIATNKEILSEHIVEGVLNDQSL